jgi:hypothetical protein
MTHYAIHTTAPVMPLSKMLGDTALIEIGKAVPGDGRPDCFYGWAEAQNPEVSGGCKPHHIVTGLDDGETAWVARTLKTLGYEVVVTTPDDPEDIYGDHSVAAGMPELYLAEHGH